MSASDLSDRVHDAIVPWDGAVYRKRRVRWPLAADLCHHKILVLDFRAIQEVLLGSEKHGFGDLSFDLIAPNAGTQHRLEVEFLLTVEAGFDPAIDLQPNTIAHGAEHVGEGINESHPGAGALDEKTPRR